MCRFFPNSIQARDLGVGFRAILDKERLRKRLTRDDQLWSQDELLTTGHVDVCEYLLPPV